VEPTPTDGARRKQATLVALVGASAALGIADAALGIAQGDDGTRIAFTLLGNVVLLVLGFRWLHFDSAELDIRRPAWLNIGIVLLAAAFVP
jgi:hypothetical protein